MFVQGIQALLVASLTAPLLEAMPPGKPVEPVEPVEPEPVEPVEEIENTPESHPAPAFPVELAVGIEFVVEVELVHTVASVDTFEVVFVVYMLPVVVLIFL
jgi:hypothetical protein